MTVVRVRSALMVVVGLSLLLASCSGERAGEDLTTPTTVVAAPLQPETTMPSVPSENPNTASGVVIERAILDLAARSNIGEDEIAVVSAQAVTWPDSSLGCPQPGVLYTQALVDGSRVLLEFGDRLYAYHAGADGVPFLCESTEGDGGYDWVPPPGFNT